MQYVKNYEIEYFNLSSNYIFMFILYLYILSVLLKYIIIIIALTNILILELGYYDENNDDDV